MSAAVKPTPFANPIATSLAQTSPLAKLRVRPLWLGRREKRRRPHTSDAGSASAATQGAVLAIEIQIAAGPYIVFELFESRVIRAGMSMELPFGTLRLGSQKSRGPYGVLPGVTFVLTFARSVTSATVAAWLCQKLQKRCYPLRMEINGTRTEVTVKAISRAIEKSLALR